MNSLEQSSALNRRSPASGLLAELETALLRLIELRDGTSECWGWDDEWEQVKAALEHAVESEKGRSANEKGEL